MATGFGCRKLLEAQKRLLRDRQTVHTVASFLPAVREGEKRFEEAKNFARRNRRKSLVWRRVRAEGG